MAARAGAASPAPSGASAPACPWAACCGATRRRAARAAFAPWAASRALPGTDASAHGKSGEEGPEGKDGAEGHGAYGRAWFAGKTGVASGQSFPLDVAFGNSGTTWAVCFVTRPVGGLTASQSRITINGPRSTLLPRSASDDTVQLWGIGPPTRVRAAPGVHAGSVMLVTPVSTPSVAANATMAMQAFGTTVAVEVRSVRGPARGTARYPLCAFSVATSADPVATSPPTWASGA
jgi:hypothetical protein